MYHIFELFYPYNRDKSRYVKKNNPKYVVTMDPLSKLKEHYGITHLSLRLMQMKDDF
ncbi:MAG: hypothetical protein K2H38_05810 [Muribaculaceae bacterium]|nr:hypothetical protein [Muribaculaceae bacterium]